MKVLLLNTNDIQGGAARAAHRLHQGLLEIGVDSQMLVQRKNSTDDRTIIAPSNTVEKVLAKIKPTLDSLPLSLYKKRSKDSFSTQWCFDIVGSKVTQIAPDIINLHWINFGFLQIESIAKLNRPVVWTLHDMWSFTGGCHYADECDRYKKSCGACPQLGSQRTDDLSQWIWQRKAKAWKDLNLMIVTPSQWLADCVRASSLLKNASIKVIPNGIDIQCFKPVEQKEARNLLNLPQEKQLILFGSISATSNRRKGFHLLELALKKLSQSAWLDRVELVVFGASEENEPIDLGLKIHYLGNISDDNSLSLVYSAVDVFVAPSIQDNLPNTVVESLACGTPCVSFNIGGMPDMIEHKNNGYLANQFDTEDLANGIAWILEDKERMVKLREQSRQKAVENFSQEIQANRYLSLYNSLLRSV